MISHKERFFKALYLEEPDIVPITDLSLDPLIVEGILGEKIGMGLTKLGSNIMELKEKGKAWNSAIKYRLALIKACKKLNFDAIPALSDYSLVDKKYEPKFIDGKKFIDQWGRIMETSIEGKTTYFVGGIINKIEDLENFNFPDPNNQDIIEMMEKIVKPLKKEDVVIMGQVHSGWHMAFQVRGGIDKLIIDFYKNPNFARKLMDKISKICQGIAKAMIDVGVDVLFVTDDYADSKSLLISPKLFKEYELPNLKRMVDIGKKNDVPILKHSDGYLYPILDDIINTGIMGLHPMEPYVMDIAYVKEKYGDKICLIGNVDCKYVLPYGSEEDVRKDVRRCIDAAGKGGGFILTSSNSLHANCKIENIYAMVDETRKYGKYPL
jgi:uroporphyrinogen decarboxylase